MELLVVHRVKCLLLSCRLELFLCTLGEHTLWQEVQFNEWVTEPCSDGGEWREEGRGEREEGRREREEGRGEREEGRGEKGEGRGEREREREEGRGEKGEGRREREGGLVNILSSKRYISMNGSLSPAVMEEGEDEWVTEFYTHGGGLMHSIVLLPCSVVQCYQNNGYIHYAVLRSVSGVPQRKQVLPSVLWQQVLQYGAVGW